MNTKVKNLLLLGYIFVGSATILYQQQGIYKLPYMWIILIFLLSSICLVVVYRNTPSKYSCKIFNI